MIKKKRLLNYGDFRKLEAGDCVACSFHRDVHVDENRMRFGVFVVAANKKESFEIILDIKNNVYYNYKMYCNPRKYGHSNLKECVLLTP